MTEKLSERTSAAPTDGLLAETERQRARWEQLCHEAEQQRDDWQRLCHEAEQQRDDWQRLCHDAEQQRDTRQRRCREAEQQREDWERRCHEAEQQRDTRQRRCREAEQQREDWERHCHEAEQQREDWERRCREAEQQRDDWERHCREAEQQRDQRLTRDGWSPVEFSLSYSGIDACREDLAQLAVRERVLLYALVFALAPDRVLEVGTFKGGSARIVSAALDDLERKGELVTIDPHPELIEIDWSAIDHNTRRIEGYFPRDFDRSSALRDLRFDLAFVDGDHSYRGVLDDLRYLPKILRPDSYVLLHDASHPEVARAIERGIADCGYRDCGKIGRVTNTSQGEPYGGMRLLWLP